MTFLAKPMPERICGVDFLNPDDPQPMFSVGLQEITRDRRGLKVVPHLAVVFALGSAPGNAEDHVMAVPPSFARALAGRLREFTDFADANCPSKNTTAPPLKNNQPIQG